MPANHTARNQWNAQVLGSTMVKVWHLYMYIARFSKALLGHVVEASSPERLTPEGCAENELRWYQAEDDVTLDSCELLLVEEKLTFQIWIDEHSALLQPAFTVNYCSAQKGVWFPTRGHVYFLKC